MKLDDYYILLDWDNIGYDEMTSRIDCWLLTREFISEIEIRTSPSLDGFHIYISTFHKINPTMIFRLRYLWHDDYQKLCMDMINKTARARGDLFSKKVHIRKGIKYEFPELKMFKYYRNNSRSQWQIINLEPLNSQTKRYNQELLH